LIDDVERYKRVTAQLTYFSDRMRDTFKQFIQLTIAIIGGFVWLKLQPGSDKVTYLLEAARWLIPFLALFLSLQIWWDFKKWRGYRRAEAEFYPGVPEGRSTMAWQEASMIIAMCLAAIFSIMFLR